MAKRSAHDKHIDRSGDDEFDYEDYVEPLAQQLFRERKGFTLGIFGGWGQGKTSLMSLLRKRVERRKKTILAIWFDAWKFDREDAVWRALLVHTVNALEGRLEQRLEKLGEPDVGAEAKSEREALEKWREAELQPLKERLYRSFTRTAKGDFQFDLPQAIKLLALVGIQTALPGSGVVMSTVKQLAGRIPRFWGSEADAGPDSAATDSAAPDNDTESSPDSTNLKEDVKIMSKALDLIKREESQSYFEHIKHLEQFQENFLELIKSARERLGVQQLIFFVDDLDRCEPDKAIAVLEAIKLFLSNEHTVFVIGVDDEVIQAGLKQRYGGWLQTLEEAQSAANGVAGAASDRRPYHQEYLEKIVQLPFTLPALSNDDVIRFIRQRLDKPLANDLVVELIRRGCAHNPRQLNRLCHLLNLNWDVAIKRQQKIRLAPAILVKLVIIQLRHRPLYRDLLDGRSAIPRRLESFWAEQQQSEGVTGERVAELGDESPALAVVEEVKKTREPATPEAAIAPYVGLSWLRELLLWNPSDTLEGVLDDEGQRCLSFQDLVREDSRYRIHEHIQLKALPREDEVVKTDAAGDVVVQLDPTLLQDLLHEDLTIIESACNRIASAADREAYATHLVGYLGDETTSWRQRVSAGDALGLLGDPRFDGDLIGSQSHWVSLAEGEVFWNDDGPDSQTFQRRQLKAIAIARFPVTNAEYEVFLTKSGYGKTPDHWRDDKMPIGLGNHPVVNVSWKDANAYVDWLGEQDRQHRYLLPSEEQWLRTARGPADIDGRENRRTFPWGDEFDVARCNTEESGLNRTTAVGCFPGGASPDGLLDMSGNVWEWCWPEGIDEGKRDDLPVDQKLSVRGGAFYNLQDGARCASRFDGLDPGYRGDVVGFRVARIRT